MARRLIVLGSVFVLLIIGLHDALGQAGMAPSAKDIAPETLLRVRSFTGLGPRAKSSTPVFQTSVGRGVKRVEDWQVISLTYDTAPAWIDELLIQFHVLSMKQNPDTKQNVFSLFQKTVRYVDIEQGREHRALVFLRPVAVKRFGTVVACAAVITLGGVLVDEPSEQSADLPEKWWKNPLVLDSPLLTVRDGYLLDRTESPWANINSDDYEVIK